MRLDRIRKKFTATQMCQNPLIGCQRPQSDKGRFRGAPKARSKINTIGTYDLPTRVIVKMKFTAFSNGSSQGNGW